MYNFNTELRNFIEINSKNNWSPTASNYPDLLWESTWPWAPIITSTINFTEIIKEIQKVDHLFVKHRTIDNIGSYGHQGWSGLTLHGIEYDKTENWDRYGFSNIQDANYHWTSICSSMPVTVELVKSMPFLKHGRVRLMKLDPGGYIMPHTDGIGRIFGPFNYAITNPVGCEFVYERFGKVPFKPGRGFMLDLGIKHCVINDSNEARYHLIIHGNPTNDIEMHFKKGIGLL